jgi:hypothetical protein
VRSPAGADWGMESWEEVEFAARLDVTVVDIFEEDLVRVCVNPGPCEREALWCGGPRNQVVTTWPRP